MGVPLVSIVLPTYNGSRFLEKSIESCLNQTFTQFELIIVDDGSSDATPEIIEQMKARDGRVISIRHETNRNLPAALNTGLSAARGEYLTWTSDDNLYMPLAIERMYSTMMDNPKVDIVYADYSIIDEQDRTIGSISVNPIRLLGFKSNCVGACFLFRKMVYLALGGYDETLFRTEDYDFWIRAAGRFSFIPLHEQLYLYRHHSRSLTSNTDSEHYRTNIRNLTKNITATTMSRRLRAGLLFHRARLHGALGEGRLQSADLVSAIAIAPCSMLLDYKNAYYVYNHFIRKRIVRPNDRSSA